MRASTGAGMEARRVEGPKSSLGGRSIAPLNSTPDWTRPHRDLTMNPDRRTLRFASLDEIMPEVGRLMAGYTAVGNWTLGQVCEHLATVKKRLVDAPARAQARPGAPRDRRAEAPGLRRPARLPEDMPMPAATRRARRRPDADRGGGAPPQGPRLLTRARRPARSPSTACSAPSARRSGTAHGAASTRAHHLSFSQAARRFDPSRQFRVGSSWRGSRPNGANASAFR